jgi:class 3 adenylate cyclase
MKHAFGIPLHHIESAYRSEFNTRLLSGNLRKCYLITLLGTVFTVPLMYLDRLREASGELDTTFGYAIFLTHLVFFLFIPIALYITIFRKMIFDATRKKVKFLVVLIVGVFTLAMIPMAIFVIPDGGSILVYGIFIMIINFVITVDHSWRLLINVLSLAIMLFSVYYFKGNDRLYATVRVIECIAITVPAFAFATFHYNTKVKEFRSKKLLQAERERSDSLLLNILPAQTATELKEKGKASTHFHEAATVLFTDFVGFSKHTLHVPPEVLIQVLNDYFNAFDAICKQYALEKIKTIGDAYMAVSGVPIANEQHALNAVYAAIAIRDFVKNYKDKALINNSLYFEIRIGLHSGALVSGVVGTQKFAFDIWGNTVNTAARIESNSEPGRINITAATYFLLEEKIPCDYRGKIKIKNMGEVEMYFVL